MIIKKMNNNNPQEKFMNEPYPDNFLFSNININEEELEKVLTFLIKKGIAKEKIKGGELNQFKPNSDPDIEGEIESAVSVPPDPFGWRYLRELLLNVESCPDTYLYLGHFKRELRSYDNQKFNTYICKAISLGLLKRENFNVSLTWLGYDFLALSSLNVAWEEVLAKVNANTTFEEINSKLTALALELFKGLDKGMNLK